jgi:hypothetical protein
MGTGEPVSCYMHEHPDSLRIAGSAKLPALRAPNKTASGQAKGLVTHQATNPTVCGDGGYIVQP